MTIENNVDLLTCNTGYCDAYLAHANHPGRPPGSSIWQLAASLGWTHSAEDMLGPEDRYAGHTCPACSQGRGPVASPRCFGCGAGIAERGAACGWCGLVDRVPPDAPNGMR